MGFDEDFFETGKEYLGDKNQFWISWQVRKRSAHRKILAPGGKNTETT